MATSTEYPGLTVINPHHAMRGTELSFGLLLKYGLRKSGYPKTVDPNLVSPVVKSVVHESVITQVLICVYMYF